MTPACDLRENTWQTTFIPFQATSYKMQTYQVSRPSASLTPTRQALSFSCLRAKLEKLLKKEQFLLFWGPKTLKSAVLTCIERCDALYSHVDYRYTQDSLLRATYVACMRAPFVYKLLLCARAHGSACRVRTRPTIMRKISHLAVL